MARTYPDFIENAERGSFTNFYHVGRDRWDYFERDGYRKLSTVLQKSKNIDWERLYVYYNDLYILIQYISNYNEKYTDSNYEITEEEFEKVIQENMDNSFINWKAIYDHIQEDYKWRQEYLNRSERIVLRVLFRYHKKLNQDDFWSP